MEKKIPALVGYLTAIGIESVILAGKNDLVVLILVLGFLAMMVSYVATYPKFTAEEIAKATFGMVYVALMMSFIFKSARAVLARDIHICQEKSGDFLTFFLKTGRNMR